jgi:methionyl aminopeptidase
MDNILSPEEINTMRIPGKVAGQFLKQLRRTIRPGISTKDIEDDFDKMLTQYPGMDAAFKGYCDYPASLCVSINDEIIHGIPRQEQIIKDGDFVSVDLGIKYKGLFVDTAYTYPTGRVSPIGRKLLKVGQNSLTRALKKVRIGAYIGDIGSTIQNYVESNGFSVIRKFVGHGIGRVLHCPPEVPNFGMEHTGEILKEGMVIAIEPMVTSGGYEVAILDDGWTVKTKDNSLSVHFEHTVAVTRRGPVIITA